MARKIKTIKLAHGIPNRDKDGVWDYRVETITDSTEFVPGQVLQKAAVDELCESSQWKVTMVKLGS